MEASQAEVSRVRRRSVVPMSAPARSRQMSSNPVAAMVRPIAIMRRPHRALLTIRVIPSRTAPIAALRNPMSPESVWS